MNNQPLHMVPCPESNIYDDEHIARFGFECPYRHQEYHWPGDTEARTNTIIRDSIIKYVKHLPDTYVQAYPGTRVEWIISKIIKGDINLASYKIIIYHLGCNNLRRLEPEEIVELFRELLLLSRS